MSGDPIERAIASLRQMAAGAASARALRDLASSINPQAAAPSETPSSPALGDPSEDLKQFQHRLRVDALAQFNAKRWRIR